MESRFDLVIIGGGPAGYTGAIRAAQLGLKTAVVEKRQSLGGTCLNIGCIPSKALLDSSEHYADAKHGLDQHGVMLTGVSLDLGRMMERKTKIVSDLTKGIDFLFKKNQITRVEGVGRVLAPVAGVAPTDRHQIEVRAADGSLQILKSKNVMLATGSIPVELPSVPFDGKYIISSTEALELTNVPEHLIVVGGGVIGLELGSVWLRLGAKVTVLEAAPEICPTMDAEIVKHLRRVLTKQGFQFQLDARLNSAKIEGGRVHLSADTKKGLLTLHADKVLVCVGRKPFTEGLGLDAAGVKLDSRGRVSVNEHWETSVPGIFAVGDVIVGPMLAHKAEEEGVAVAEHLAGRHGHVNYQTVPGVVYTWPEVASVGLTEEELKSKNIDYAKGSFPFLANGRAKALGCTDGMVKILSDKKTDRILGVHILGPRASDLIGEAVVAMEFHGSSEDLARSFHAHPTLGEAIREAALAVDGRVRQL